MSSSDWGVVNALCGHWCCREDCRTWSFRRSKSHNKVFVGEPVEGSLTCREHRKEMRAKAHSHRQRQKKTDVTSSLAAAMERTWRKSGRRAPHHHRWGGAALARLKKAYFFELTNFYESVQPMPVRIRLLPCRQNWCEKCEASAEAHEVWDCCSAGGQTVEEEPAPHRSGQSHQVDGATRECVTASRTSVSSSGTPTCPSGHAVCWRRSGLGGRSCFVEVNTWKWVADFLKAVLKAKKVNFLYKGPFWDLHYLPNHCK